MNYILKIAFIFIFFFGVSTAYLFGQDTTVIKKDTLVQNKGLNELPNVNLKNLNGDIINIKSLADSGKITIISFWALWCGPCIKELDNTKSLLAEWEKKFNVQFIAVSIDDSRTTIKVKPFVSQKGWKYNVLLDPNKDLARELNVNNPPVLLIYNEFGQLIYQHQGYTEGSEYDVEDKLKAYTKKN